MRFEQLTLSPNVRHERQRLRELRDEFASKQQDPKAWVKRVLEKPMSQTTMTVRAMAKAAR